MSPRVIDADHDDGQQKGGEHCGCDDCVCHACIVPSERVIVKRENDLSGSSPPSHPSYRSRMIRLKKITVMMVMMVIVLPLSFCVRVLYQVVGILSSDQS